MMIPLNILKWALPFVGIYGLVTDEIDATASLLMIAIGVVWILVTSKSGNTHSGATSSPKNVAAKKTEQVPETDHHGICPQCHAKCEEDAIYCENCGHKLK